MPLDDGIMADCQADLSRAQAALDAVTAACRQVAQLDGTTTWQGPAAGRWSTEFAAQVKALQAVVAAFPGWRAEALAEARREVTQLHAVQHPTPTPR